VLERAHETWSPVETVSGVQSVRFTIPPDAPALGAILEYKEETADYSEVAISIPSGPLHEGELTAGASFEFELALPPDALPSYKSRHGELIGSST
jgi:hypothetical protein